MYLTLTSVVFELSLYIMLFLEKVYLTLTSVVFESKSCKKKSKSGSDLTLTSVVFESFFYNRYRQLHII